MAAEAPNREPRRPGNLWAFDTDAARSPRAPTASTRPDPIRAVASESTGSRAAPAADASTSEAVQVRAYFTHLNLASAAAPTSSDPHAMAGDLLAAATKGDYSGLDALADSQQQMIDSIQLIDPPDSCSEHHRLTLRTLEQGRDMIVSMKANIASGDVEQLMLSSVQSQALTRDAEEVDRLGQQLKMQYGIP